MEINFIRRLYFDPSTGKILCGVYREGDIIYTPPEDDFAEQEELQGCSLADVGLLEWLKKDAEIEAALATMQASVDITADPPELVFTPLEIPESPAGPLEEALDALKELGVEVNENA